MSRLSRLGFIDVRRTANPVQRKVRPRGVPPSLANHEIFYTENPTDARRMISKALAPMSISIEPKDLAGFAATMNGVRLRNVSMLYLDLHIPAVIDIPAVGTYFGVHMQLNGCARIDYRGRTFEANTLRALVTSPGEPLRLQLDHDCPQLLIRIEQGAMSTYLTRLLGRALTKPLEFEPEFDLASAAAMRWHAAVQLIHTEVLHDNSLIHRGQGISPVEELVMSSLLHLQPSNYHREFLPSHHLPTPRRAAVHEAMEYLEQHLAEQLSMDELAAALHISVRSIQQGFRDELNLTPTTYLRERRLERVHEELTDALPSDGVTVTAVAQRWGFRHLGSFAVEYRKRWGETPSATLRR